MKRTRPLFTVVVVVAGSFFASRAIAKLRDAKEHIAASNH
jgi:hypothetical protein